MRNETRASGSVVRRSWSLVGRGMLMTRQVAAAGSALRSVAEQYVKLVLAVGQHDADYVDAFYGPAEWRTEAEAAKKPLAAIDAAGRGGRERTGRASS